MASLYKKPVMIKDPTTGMKIKTKSKKWWGQYKDALGRLRRVPLAVDKLSAQAKLNDLVKKVEREMAWSIPPMNNENGLCTSTSPNSALPSRIEALPTSRSWKRSASCKK
jgi:hypothetical protein